ncbi:MAG TPA: hypothetical protein VIC33_10845, partial [Vicinamibacterales bacterium]
ELGNQYGRWLTSSGHLTITIQPFGSIDGDARQKASAYISRCTRRTSVVTCIDPVTVTTEARKHSPT